MTAAVAHRNRPMRFGLHTALPRSSDFTEFAVTVEQSGFDVLTIPDHLTASLAPFAGAATACALRPRHCIPARSCSTTIYATR